MTPTAASSIPGSARVAHAGLAPEEEEMSADFGNDHEELPPVDVDALAEVAQEKEDGAVGVPWRSRMASQSGFANGDGLPHVGFPEWVNTSVIATDDHAKREMQELKNRAYEEVRYRRVLESKTRGTFACLIAGMKKVVKNILISDPSRINRDLASLTSHSEGGFRNCAEFLREMHHASLGLMLLLKNEDLLDEYTCLLSELPLITVDTLGDSCLASR
jgi:hypothetical protein